MLEGCPDIRDASLCSLGQPPNPVLSTLRYFKENMLPVRDKHCPAGVQSLLRPRWTKEIRACGLCAKACALSHHGPPNSRTGLLEKCTHCAISDRVPGKLSKVFEDVADLGGTGTRRGR